MDSNDPRRQYVRDEQERRYKMLSLGPQFVFNILRSGNANEFMSLRVTDGLPEDAEIVAIDWSYEKQCWQLVVYSKEYDVVPQGQYIPVAMDIGVSSKIFKRIKFSNTYEEVK